MLRIQLIGSVPSNSKAILKQLIQVEILEQWIGPLQDLYLR